MQIGGDKVPAGPRVAVHLANGKLYETEKVLAEQSSKGGTQIYLYYDEDFVKQMQRPEHSNLRKKYPDTREARAKGEPG